MRKGRRKTRTRVYVGGAADGRQEKRKSKLGQEKKEGRKRELGIRYVCR